MAQAEHLPIYKGSHELCLYLEQVVQGFSRYHKDSLGADLRRAQRVLKLVVRANSPPAPAGPGARVRQRREQAERVTASSNYWSATTNADHPANAWNVNFDNGNAIGSICCASSRG